MNAPKESASEFALSRREFLKASGALMVSASGLAVTAESLAQAAASGKPPLVPVELDSWIADRKSTRLNSSHT